MILIIDGYNILKQVSPTPYITDRERQAFIQQLSYYCQIKDHLCIVFFDGGESDKEYIERARAITIIFSGQQQSADAAIKHYIKKNYTKDLLIITSDREINAYADQFSVASLDARAFYDIMMQTYREQDQAKKQGVAQKISTVENPELDLLMQESMVDKIEQDTSAKERKSAGQRESKIEKMLKKKIKKL